MKAVQIIPVIMIAVGVLNVQMCNNFINLADFGPFRFNEPVAWCLGTNRSTSQ